MDPRLGGPGSGGGGDILGSHVLVIGRHDEHEVLSFLSEQEF